MELLAWANVSRQRWFSSLEKDAPGADKDVEAYFYRETCCLGIQGHPEYRGYPYFSKWSLDQIQKHIIENPDIEWADASHPSGQAGFRRIKGDLLAQRAALKGGK